MTTPEMKPLLSIKSEAALCRKAWKDMPVGTMAWHCHHGALSEVLTEPAENRIAYILSHKPNKEQALRRRLFRPAPTLAPAWAEYKRVKAAEHAKCCPDCPWDGHTIFPRKP